MYPALQQVWGEHWRALLELSLVMALRLLHSWQQRRSEQRARLQLLQTRSSQYELLVRERRQHTCEHNETIRIMSTAYATEEPPTLDDLLSSAERDWSLRSSEAPSHKTPVEKSYNRPVERSSRPPPPPRKR